MNGGKIAVVTAVVCVGNVKRSTPVFNLATPTMHFIFIRDQIIRVARTQTPEI
jgi:hypothetical protein